MTHLTYGGRDTACRAELRPGDSLEYTLAAVSCGACMRVEFGRRALIRDHARAIERRRATFRKKFR